MYSGIFYVIGNCCYVVVVRQEFRKKFLLVFAAEQTLFYDIMFANFLSFVR